MFYKNIDNGYIVSISPDCGKAEISSIEYHEILNTIKSKPADPEGYAYRLKTDLTWELVKLPPIEIDSEEQATAEDYEEALGRFGV